MINKQTEHWGEYKEAKTYCQVTERQSGAALITCFIPTCKFLALSSWRQRAGAFLVQVGMLGGTGPLLWEQVCILGSGRGSEVLMHIRALITQPLVAECTQALCKRRLWALWAALEDAQRKETILVFKICSKHSHTHRVIQRWSGICQKHSCCRFALG